MKKYVLLILSAVAACVLLSTTFLTSSASAAPARPATHGGGCTTIPLMQACISGSGNTVKADGYLTKSAGSDCLAVYVYILDSNKRPIGSPVKNTCALGHKIGPNHAANGNFYSQIGIGYKACTTPSGCLRQGNVTSPVITP